MSPHNPFAIESPHTDVSKKLTHATSGQGFNYRAAPTAPRRQVGEGLVIDNMLINIDGIVNVLRLAPRASDCRPQSQTPLDTNPAYALEAGQTIE